MKQHTKVNEKLLLPKGKCFSLFYRRHLSFFLSYSAAATIAQFYFILFFNNKKNKVEEGGKC
jgi:hypothetical protein